MITVLLIAILIVTLTQPNAPRLFAAVIFAGVTLLHEVLLSDLTGLQYYGSAALFDLAIIVATSGINPVPKMVLSLHKICIVSIFVNFIGWLLWYYYYPPIVYDVTFVVIYIWTLVTFLNREKLRDVGGYAVGRWFSCLRFDRVTWRFYTNNHTGKT